MDNQSEKSIDRHARPNAFKRLFRLARKELVEILRDRRTIITLVLMPLLLYPLLGITIQKFLLRSLADAEQPKIRIVVESGESGRQLETMLKVGHQLVWFKENQGQPDPIDSSDRAKIPPTADGDSQNRAGSEATDADRARQRELIEAMKAQEPDVKVYLPDDDQTVAQLVRDGTFDIGVLVEVDRVGRPQFELLHREGSATSAQALKFVQNRLEAVNQQWVRRILRQRKLPSKLPADFQVTKVGEQKADQTSLLTFIPLLLVLMTMTGAVYPAIDLTAGERERGTMEILVAAPVSRMALLFGKFVAVLSVAMLTAMVNILAMFVTVYTLGLEKIVFGEAGLSYPVMGLVLLLLFVFAAFFSATLLGLTSFARSFKEAQAYLIPLMLVSLAPGMLSLAPNIELSPMLAIVPLVNIILLSRDLLVGDASLSLAVITIVSTLLYGVMALGIAARIFGADSVLAGGGNSWSDFLRRPEQALPRPLISTAMLFLAILFPSFIVIGGLGGRLETSIANRLLFNAAVTFVLFVALPFLFTRLFHLKPKGTFQWLVPPASGMIAAALLGVSVWVLAYELEVFTLTGERIQKLTELFESMKVEMGQLSLPLKLFCLAITPAVCEELTFRGFLFSSLKGRMSNTLVVIITALLFGLFHVFVRDALLFERMIPSTLMGVLLGFVCLKTGSVIPGILLHVLHNGLLITISHYENQLAAWGIGMSEQKHLPIEWVLTALVPIAIGILLLVFMPRGDQSSEMETNDEESDSEPAAEELLAAER